MRAFDFVITLYSFVYALSIARILDTVGDMLLAGKRVRFSWLHAGWMLNILLAVVAWWLSLWDLRAQEDWSMPTVLMFFVVACLLYVLARMVSPLIPEAGEVDLRQYHLDEGQKYAAVFALECAITVGTVFLYGASTVNWVATNWATLPTLVAAIAAACTNNRWVHRSALAVMMILWVWYFATLQGALA